MIASAEASRELMIAQIPSGLKEDISNHIKDYCSKGYTGCNITYGTEDSKKYHLSVIHGAVSVWLRSYGYNSVEYTDIGNSWVFKIDWIPNN